jgi:SAM-dependent methyltransferase
MARELEGASLVLHGVSVQRPRALRELLLSGHHVFGLTPRVGEPLPCFVARADSGRDHDGNAAAAEVAAVRARRAGAPISWGPSIPFSGAPKLLQWQFARGRCSVHEIRRDPSLASGMQIGRWFGARWQIRALRTAVTALPAPTARALARVAAMIPTETFGRLAADLAFWAGVRATASDAEWSALARDSYVALCYHRITDDRVPGQERMSLPPAVFRRQVRLLRLLRYRALSPDDIVAFHKGTALIGRRRYALTADDGFIDCVAETIAVGARAQLFVPTAAPGRRAWWTEGGEVADWSQLLAAAEAGATIGSHGRLHLPLVDLDDEQLHAELEGSRAELSAHLPASRALVAYPNGRYDERVRSMAIDAGYEAAYTTDPGRNSMATDAWSLRRVTPKSWDSRLSFLYRVFTGEPVPARWDTRRQRVAARSTERRSIAFTLRRRAEYKAERLVRTTSPGRRFRTALVDEALERRFSESRRLKLLDAGSEDGVLATQIAGRRPTWLIVGIDLNLGALRDGQRWAADNDVRNISFVQADITTLMRENAFDAAIAIDSLAEVPDDEGALLAIARSLRPGGLFITHTPVAGWEPVLAGSARYWPRAVRRGHEPAELVAKIEAVGLVVDEIRPTFRSLGHLAQEVRDRWLKPRRLVVRLAAYPFLLGAVWLERAGFSWGAHRELFVVAHRPHDAGNERCREEQDDADSG